MSTGISSKASSEPGALKGCPSRASAVCASGKTSSWICRLYGWKGVWLPLRKRPGLLAVPSSKPKPGYLSEGESRKGPGPGPAWQWLWACSGPGDAMLGLCGGREGAFSGGPSGTNDEQLKLACFWEDRGKIAHVGRGVGAGSGVCQHAALCWAEGCEMELWATLK